MNSKPIIQAQFLSTLLTKKYQFIDLRDPYEFNKLHLSPFINIPFDSFNEHIPQLYKQIPIILLCYTGHRSLKLAQSLNQLGYHAYSVEGGFYTIQYELKRHSSF